MSRLAPADWKLRWRAAIGGGVAGLAAVTVWLMSLWAIEAIVRAVGLSEWSIGVSVIANQYWFALPIFFIVGVGVVRLFAPPWKLASISCCLTVLASLLLLDAVALIGGGVSLQDGGWAIVPQVTAPLAILAGGYAGRSAA